MKLLISVFLILASSASLAQKPELFPINNGNHYAYGKQQNNGNRSGNRQESVSIPEASTLALIGAGFAGLVIARRRKK